MKHTIKGNLTVILNDLVKSGFKPILVGGCVRDFLLDIPSKDIDVEVYGIGYDGLLNFLSHYGKCDVVGKAFGVIKFENEYDFSIPRKETKSGTGHKGFDIDFNVPTMEDAFRRRDFTFNAIGFNWESEEYIDFFGGIKDLQHGVIRHIDDVTFKEDALRILRAMQFQARFCFIISDDTMDLIQQMVRNNALDELPLERIAEEWKKWAVKGQDHDFIFSFLRDSSIGDKYLSELMKLKQTKQDKYHHPEGDVERHTKLVLNEANEISNRDKISDDEKEVLIFSALLHDIAKPICTDFCERDGEIRITSHGHESAGVPITKKILKRIGVRKEISDKILKLIEFHMYSINFKNIKDEKSKQKFVLKLKRKLGVATITELMRLMESDLSGRHPLPKGLPDFAKEVYEVSKTMKISSDEKFNNIINGNHLIEMGFEPSELFKDILESCVQAQIDGIITDVGSGKDFIYKLFKKGKTYVSR